MRKAWLYIFILLLFSCANESRNKEIEASIADIDGANYNLTLEQLASNKLYEYFELLQLKQQHPEFKETISSQLKRFSPKNNLSTKYTGAIEIITITSLGEIQKVTDSTQVMKVYYEAKQDGITIQDSINSFFISKSITIENQEINSTKVEFSIIQ